LLDTDLVSIWYVDGLPAFGHMAGDSRAPCHPHFVLLLHFLHGAAGAHIEQLRDETSAGEMESKVENYKLCWRRQLSSIVIGHNANFSYSTERKNNNSVFQNIISHMASAC